jgi:cation-transporting ATPase E
MNVAPERPAVDGLTAAEVAERVRDGRTNADRTRPSRSVPDILKANVFTFFNGLLLVLLVAILVFGSPKDALFGFVLVFNALVGIVQELRAKRTLDRLSLLAAPRARVVRDGVVTEIAVGEVVLDDVVELRPGDQIVADGEVLTAAGLELDESLLTGESHAVEKRPGSRVLSGSFCVAGDGRMRATGVGAASYARQLAAEARVFRPLTSELRRGTNRILKVITVALVPISVLLIVTRWPMSHDLHAIVPETVSALVGMVPQGLVLLTSIAFAVGAIRLVRRKALVEELGAVEVLARVDVLCLDKTGTLTEPELELELVEVVAENSDDAEVRAALGAMSAAVPAGSRNATTRALAAALPARPGWTVAEIVPFSSGRKWSAATFAEQGAWVQGAPDILLPADDPVRGRAAVMAATGARVLVLARAAALPSTGAPVSGLSAVALVVLGERIRSDAAETLAYFREEGVTLKVISGDSPATVGSVACRAGLEMLGEPVDATTLPTDPEELACVMETHTVFGRVKPDQKRDMVRALQARGHTVAMTGDGVNDTLALKTADLGIAMGSGAAAAKAVAGLVLLEGSFATLPHVVAEGRRVIANVERVANLFVTKTVYAALLAVAVSLFGISYPLLPRHFTLVDMLTIGIPGFFLALAAGAPRYRAGYLSRVLRFVAVTGPITAAAAFGANAWALNAQGPMTPGTVAVARTAAVLTLCIVGLWVLGVLARPWTAARIGLVAALAAGLAGVKIFMPARAFLELPLSPSGTWAVLVIVSVAAIAAIEGGLRVSGWRAARS